MMNNKDLFDKAKIKHNEFKMLELELLTNLLREYNIKNELIILDDLWDGIQDGMDWTTTKRILDEKVKLYKKCK